MPFRPPRVLFQTAALAALAMLPGLTGCGSLMTSELVAPLVAPLGGSMTPTRTVEQFTAGLEASDYATLRSLASPRFAAAALPDEGSLGTFDLVGLPVGEVTVDEVRETSPTKREVRCSVGPQSERLMFDLVRSGEQAAWTVDEITMRRGKGKAAVSRTVSEQMELLLTVRDLIRTWQRDDTEANIEAKLATAEPLLADSLRTLPAAWQAQLLDEFFGGVLRSAPKAKLVDGQARIELSHKNGRLRLLLAQAEDDAGNDAGDDAEVDADASWRLRTAVLTEGRGDKVERDLRDEADILDAAGRFITAMESGDLDAAAEAATSTLAGNALKRSDTLGANETYGQMLAAEYALRLAASRTEVTIDRGEVVHQITVRTADESGERSVDPLVEEVTTYDGDSVTRLSATLTLASTIRLFHDSLLAGEIGPLKMLSTTAFDEEVWLQFSRAELAAGFGTSRRDVLSRIVLDPLPDAEPEIAWNGPQMVATFRTGPGEGTAIAYELTSSGQETLVDDIRIDGQSLRVELGSLLVMDQMADALATGDAVAVKDASTPELSQVVWDLQLPEDLPTRLDLMPVLTQIPLAIDVTPIDTIVTVSGAKLVLREVGGRLRIGDVIYLDAAGRETTRFATEVRNERHANAIGAE